MLIGSLDTEFQLCYDRFRKHASASIDEEASQGGEECDVQVRKKIKTGHDKPSMIAYVNKMKTFINKMYVSDQLQLLMPSKRKYLSADEVSRLDTLYCMQSRQHIINTAFDYIKAESMITTLREIFQQYISVNDVNDDRFPTVWESCYLFRKWCELNMWNYQEFLQCVRVVLDKELIKRNMFIIEGVSNAGKTFFMKSIANMYRFVGEIAELATDVK